MNQIHNAIDIANYFINNSLISDLSNMKLQKLLYYSQGLCLVLIGKPLFQEDIEAWEYGPVIRDIYTQFKEYGSDSIPRRQSDKKLDQQVEVILDATINTFGKLSTLELSDLSHNETPWKTTIRNKAIDLGEIKSYFEDNYVSLDKNNIPVLDTPFSNKYPIYELKDYNLLRNEEDINKVLDALIERRQEVYKALAQ